MVSFATAVDVVEGIRQFRAGRAGILRTPGYRAAYVDQGDIGAPAVVFVHGLSDQAISFSMMTARLVRAGFRTVAVELADGAGDGANLGRYRHSDHARDLVALFDELNLARPALFASSYGSTVAVRLMSDYPGRLARCVLQGGFVRRPLNWAEVMLAQAARYFPGRMGDLPGRPRVLAAIDAPQFSGAAHEVYDFMLRCSGRSPIRAVAQRALVLSTLDLRPSLKHIRTPVLLIGGVSDPIVPRHCEAELESGLADVRRVEFPGGHYPQYTLPGPTADAVAEFVR